MSELVSQRAGAEALGIALSTLQHHVKRGNVTLVEGKVDVELAKRQLAQRIDADQSIRGRQNGPPPRVPVGGGVNDAARGREESSPALWREKERAERARASLLEMDLAKARGDLVDRADVETAMATKLTGARDMLLSVADRLAPVLAAESDIGKVHEHITAEIRRAMRSISAEAPPGES